MKIKNVEKWESDLIYALKFHYDIEHVAATGKSDNACDFAFEHELNHYEFVEDDYKCVALYNAVRIRGKNNRIIYLVLRTDGIEFYKDKQTYYVYDGCEPYEYSANKYSYIIGLVNIINKYLEV